jgi:4-azaleucine resistance transporter AzlC
VDPALTPARDTADRRPDLRRLALDALGIAVSAGGFGIVYGLSARQAGLSLVEALAMSVFVLAGAAQFAAIGLIVSGVPWIAIVAFTGLLNARHLLYAAALAPWVQRWPRIERAAMAHVLTDETFALALPFFRLAGRADRRAYWMVAAIDVVPWIALTVLGYVSGELIPDPTRLGLDVVFPAAMAGLCLALITQRRDVVAAVAGVGIAVVGSLLFEPAIGIVAGGSLAPLVALLVPSRPEPPGPDLQPASLVP